MSKKHWANFDLQIINGLDEAIRRKLKNKFKIQKFDLEDIFTDTQLSKIEKRSGYFYIALQFPEYSKVKTQFETKEIHCLLSKGYLVVIDKDDYKDIKPFLNLAKNLVPAEADSFDMFFELLDFIITKNVKAVSKFKKEVDGLESNLFDFDDKPKDLIKQILVLKRNIINFQSLMLPLQTVLTDFQTKYDIANNPESAEKADDSLDKIKKIINNLQNLKEQMVLVSEANETILTRSTNDIIKALTGVNVIVLIPSIITSFFGMNIYFGWDPAQPNLFELLMIVVFAIICTALTWLYFKRRNWV